MGHLTNETLARLVSDGPSPEEAAHLGSCETCRGELSVFREQTEALGALPDLRPPAGDWEALEGRLLSEGLIRSSGVAWRASRIRGSGWLQAAAALVLFLGGTAMGVGVTRSDGGAAGPVGSPPSDLEFVAVAPNATQVSTLSEAAEAVRIAERQFHDALLRYRQLVDARGEPSYLGDPTSRLAALQALVAAGQAAVREAPADPIVNGVLVSALAEQEAILRNASWSSSDGVF
jgi:hypothetical protein